MSFKEKDEIYRIADSIVSLEEREYISPDKIREIKQAKEEYKKNENYILEIKNIINSNEIKCHEMIEKLQKQLKNLEEDLHSLERNRGKDMENKHKEMEDRQKLLNQNLIKQKFSEQTNILYNLTLSNITERLKMLKEEKITSTNDLIELISLRELYDNYIYFHISEVFKNVIIDTNGENIMNKTEEKNMINITFNTLKHQISVYDIKEANIPFKLSNYLYKIITNKSCIPPLTSLKMDLLSLITEEYNVLQSVPEFVDNICARISQEKKIGLEAYIVEEKLNKLLYYIIKYLILDTNINGLLKFVNDEYKINKNKLKEEISEYKDKINTQKELEDNLKKEEKELRLHMHMKNRDIEELDKLKNIIKEKEDEITKALNGMPDINKDMRDRMEILNKRNNIIYKQYGKYFNVTLIENKVNENNNNIDNLYIEMKKKFKGNKELINLFVNNLNDICK